MPKKEKKDLKVEDEKQDRRKEKNYLRLKKIQSLEKLKAKEIKKKSKIKKSVIF